MKLFNAAAIIIATAAPSATSAVEIGAPTNYFGERELQDEVGSMPFDAIEAVEPMDGLGIDDLKCVLGGGVLGADGFLVDKLDALCDFADSTLAICGDWDRRRRRLDGHEDPCDELCLDADFFFYEYCCTGKECIRRLSGEIETVPHHRLLEVVESVRGDPAGFSTFKDNVLPDSAADTLRAHIEGLYDAEGFPPVASLPAEGNFDKQVYTKDIDGSELISLIGKDNTKNLLNYFHEAIGVKAPVTNIQVQIGKHMDKGQFFDYHRDGAATLLVYLNDNDDIFQGGDNHYVTAEGHMIVPVKKGRAIVHGPATVHGVSLWRGDRVVMSFETSSSMFDTCLIKDSLDDKVGPGKRKLVSYDDGSNRRELRRKR